LTDKTLNWLMQPGPAYRVYNEVPVQYRRDERSVFGVIDRLVVGENQAYLVDYKSHRLDAATDLTELREHYRPQLALYREAVQRLWPDRRVSTYLLLTGDTRLLELSWD
jgi:ATP-dependent helicase/nuclease subunit A